MSAPELFHAHEKHHSFDNNSEQFAIDDFLNLHNEDNDEQEAINVVNDGVVTDNVNVNGKSTYSSTIIGDSSNSNSLAGCHDHSMKDVQFTGELVVHQDDLAELEWVSRFQEDSFSGEELQKMQLISGIMPQSSNSIQLDQSNGKNNENSNDPIFVSDVQVPAKAKRSKRPRIAPCDWKSRLVAISDKSQPTQDLVVTAQPQQLHAPIKRATKRKDNGDNGEGRKCLHCATDKTPQWRTGPLGPKTLCNACGVRYKSGRLVPEYRPAASPTFVLTKHSNSHRKVMELRRQKELKTQVQHMQNEHHQQQQLFLHEQHQGIVFDVHNSEDYLIHQHMGVEFESLVNSFD